MLIHYLFLIYTFANVLQKKKKSRKHDRRAKIKDSLRIKGEREGSTWTRDKINFAVTVIPRTVRQRVKYEQKSRHRYRVYANSRGKIDEQDVTANIRLPHLSYCRCLRTHVRSLLARTCPCTRVHSLLVSAASALARFVSARFARNYIYRLCFPDTPDASRSAASISFVCSVDYRSSFFSVSHRSCFFPWLWRPPSRVPSFSRKNSI